jgi:hypothetical protein
MPNSVPDFEDDTAFERYVLDRVALLAPAAGGSSVVDLRGGGAAVQVGLADGSACADPNSHLTPTELRILVFGAAWKVLDLLIELALRQAGTAPQNQKTNRYQIKEKIDHASGATPVTGIAPFDSSPDHWTRLRCIYAETAELRHSLVHRRLHVDPVSGTITGTGGNGALLPSSLTQPEQDAFSRAVQGAAAAVINQKLDTREGGHLTWVLDQLAAHHNQPLLSASAIHPMIPIVRADAAELPSGELTFDPPAIRTAATAQVQGVSFYNLHLYLPDGRVLAAHLEDLPDQNVYFSPAAPPAGLTWT